VCCAGVRGAVLGARGGGGVFSGWGRGKITSVRVAVGGEPARTNY